MLRYYNYPSNQASRHQKSLFAQFMRQDEEGGIEKLHMRPKLETQNSSLIQHELNLFQIS
jgi:hypothetical protein